MKTLGRAFSITLGVLLGILIFFLIISLASGLFYKYMPPPKEKYSFIEGSQSSLNKVVIIELNGLILNQSKQRMPLLNSQVIYANKIEKLLDNLADQKEIKAIIISINSPGGSVSGSNRFHNAIVNFKNKSIAPIYVHTNELLASGALWSTIAADRIYASYGAMIGSIGVKGPSWFVYNKPTSMKIDFFGPDISTAEGIDHYQPYAGRSKDIFNPFRNPTQDELLEIQKMLDSIYDKFVNLVSANRKIEKKYIKENIGAMFFDSNQAKVHNLIDDIFSLDSVKNNTIKYLEIQNDYQIIKIENKSNFINEISNITFNTKSDISIQINTDICGLYYQQIVLLSNYNFSVCEN